MNRSALPSPLLDLRERIPPLDWTETFAEDIDSIEIEIGSGRGMFLRREGAAHPKTGFLGIEQARKWFAVCAHRIARDRLHNVRLIHGDAFELMARWVPLASVSAVHILFPDPWPKKRHAKRRLLQPAMFDLVARALTTDGTFAIATDVDWYFEETASRLAEHPCFVEIETTAAEAAAFRTHYAVKYERRGRNLNRIRYARTSVSPPPTPPPPSRRQASANRSPLLASADGP